MFAAPQAKIATPVSNVLQKTVTLLDLNQLNSSKGTCYWQLRYSKFERQLLDSRLRNRKKGNKTEYANNFQDSDGHLS